jgi:adenylate cyclase class 2
VLDQTPIGDVAEIEGESEWIDRTAQKLGVGTADYITKSYIELFFEWKRSNNRKAENMTFEEIGSNPISH